MHELVHIISKRALSDYDIDSILSPYDERNVYRYSLKTGEYESPNLRPPFTWDYYTIHNPVWYRKVEDCSILIDPNGHVISRRWWNGKVHVDQNQLFEEFCTMHHKRWHGCYLYEVDIHW